jgi:hypothetical protein
VTVELPIDADAALGLPVDRLALHLLRDIKAASEADANWQPHRYNFLNGAHVGYSQAGLERDQVTAVTQALAEAYDWLLLHGLLAIAPRDYNSGWLFITRKGEAVLAAADGVQLVQAEARLDADMHLRIAQQVKSQFLLGAYEFAAIAALREVEIRVRELAKAAPRDVGVDLMKAILREGRSAN